MYEREKKVIPKESLYRRKKTDEEINNHGDYDRVTESSAAVEVSSK